MPVQQEAEIRSLYFLDKGNDMPALQNEELKGIAAPENHMTGLERAWHIDKALVGRAAEKEVGIALRFNKRAVDKDVNELKQSPLGRHIKKSLEGIARVAPYILGRAGADSPCQPGKALGLLHRIAAREGDTGGKRIRLDNSQQFLNSRLPTAVRCPRLRIVATGAMVSAACAIDAGAETRTINSSVVDDGEDAKTGLSPLPLPCREGSRMFCSLIADCIHFIKRIFPLCSILESIQLQFCSFYEGIYPPSVYF